MKVVLLMFLLYLDIPNLYSKTLFFLLMLFFLESVHQLSEIEDDFKDVFLFSCLLNYGSRKCIIYCIDTEEIKLMIESIHKLNDFYYLDLLNHRTISAKIAEDFNVYHESPQILLIKNGECVYDESHSGIRMEDIVEEVIK